MTEKTEGRDKFAKCIQYGSRFWAWYFLSLNNKSEMGKKLFSMYKLTALSRKVFRVVKILNEIDKLNETLKEKNVPAWLLLFKVLKHVGIGTFWVYDNFLFLNEVSLSPVEPSTASLCTARGWFLSNLCGLITFSAEMHKAYSKRMLLAERLATEQDRDQRALLEDEMQKFSVKQFNSFLMLVKTCCDITVSGNMPGLDIPKKLLGEKLSDGVVGILGMVSGSIICFNNWPNESATPQKSRAEGHAKFA